MKPIDTDRTYCEASGFINVETIDRNSWYHDYCTELAERLRGPFQKTYVEALGEEGARDGIAAVDEHVILTSQGQLRPGHLRGQKQE